MPSNIFYAVPAVVFCVTFYVAQEYAFSELSTSILAALVPSALMACWQWAKGRQEEEQGLREKILEHLGRQEEEQELKQKLLEHMDAQDNAMRTVLRNDLEAYHRRFVNRGGITTREHELAHMTYLAYHDVLHANGTGTKLWEEIDELPLID